MVGLATTVDVEVAALRVAFGVALYFATMEAFISGVTGKSVATIPKRYCGVAAWEGWLTPMLAATATEATAASAVSLERSIMHRALYLDALRPEGSAPGTALPPIEGDGGESAVVPRPADSVRTRPAHAELPA
jgi:hypothetical protein